MKISFDEIDQYNDPYQLFVDSIKSDETKRRYKKNLHRFLKLIPNEIRKLRKVIDLDENTSDEDFLAYCNENFQKIVSELEPKVVAEFRHPDSIN